MSQQTSAKKTGRAAGPAGMLVDGSPDGLVRDFCFYSQCLSSRPGKAEGLPIRNVVLARQ